MASWAVLFTAAVKDVNAFIKHQLRNTNTERKQKMLTKCIGNLADGYPCMDIDLEASVKNETFITGGNKRVSE